LLDPDGGRPASAVHGALVTLTSIDTPVTREQMPAQARYVLAIRPIEFFRASEHVDEDHVRMLAAGIKAAGVWTAPVPVEAGSGFVMDGNHRLAVARRLNLRCLPCIPLRYGDPGLEVRCWTTGRHYPIADLLTAIGRQELLPFKSTRHLFNPPLPGSEIPLALLREGFTQ
jgi:hypothetical protein